MNNRRTRPVLLEVARHRQSGETARRGPAPKQPVDEPAVQPQPAPEPLREESPPARSVSSSAANAARGIMNRAARAIAAVQGAATPTHPTRGLPRSRAGAAAAAQPMLVERAPGEPAVRVEGDRIFLTLRWQIAAVAGVGLLLLLIIAFQFGRSTSGQQTPTVVNDPLSSVASTQAQQPKEKAVQPLVERPAVTPPSQPPAPPAASEFVAQRGYHYVIVQHFRQSAYDKAVEAREYLKQNEIDSVLVKRGSSYVLIATTPFLIDQKDARAKAAETKKAEALRERVRTVGKGFASRGYAFDQCTLEQAR